jgi:hypothetical protein
MSAAIVRIWVQADQAAEQVMHSLKSYASRACMNEDWIRAIEGVGRATAVRDIFGRGRRYSQRYVMLSADKVKQCPWEMGTD